MGKLKSVVFNFVVGSFREVHIKTDVNIDVEGIGLGLTTQTVNMMVIKNEGYKKVNSLKNRVINLRKKIILEFCKESSGNFKYPERRLIKTKM